MVTGNRICIMYTEVVLAFDIVSRYDFGKSQNIFIFYKLRCVIKTLQSFLYRNVNNSLLQFTQQAYIEDRNCY